MRRRSLYRLRVTVTAIAVVTVVLGVTGCGSSHSHSPFNGPARTTNASAPATTAHHTSTSPVPVTSTTTATTDATTAPTPSPTTATSDTSGGSGTQTWTMDITFGSGYTGGIQITAGPIEHANQTDVGVCPNVNPSTDAEIPMTIMYTNTTPNFSSNSGVSMGTPDNFDGGIVDSGGCEGGQQTAGATETPDSPLQSGRSFTYSVFVWVPNYYTPQTPSGDPSELDGIVTLGTSMGVRNETYATTGPDGEPKDASSLNLSALAG
jgi:hypothetical protein